MTKRVFNTSDDEKRGVCNLDSGAASPAAGPAIPGGFGSKGISGLQMEAVRLLTEDQVSPVPTTYHCVPGPSPPWKRTYWQSELSGSRAWNWETA